ncbi:hypothetical protein CF336_g9253 [Tilletia laevis]|nr:hypothetical protein CF336_g9253 [Tilletia laevis]KAE8180667.1 hypothetical protein CF335_g9172 [Tilletia laevis]KAE8183041.1 hypothetical protein CF328_g8318 [Tilletia controversa]
MTSWYRMFIPDFARKARPINEAIHKTPFRWTKAANDAFEILKTALSSPPVLMRQDRSKPLILDVDASSKGFGAALIQKDQDGKEHPILFLSRQTKNAEERYPATHLELQAIAWAGEEARALHRRR